MKLYGVAPKAVRQLTRPIGRVQLLPSTRSILTCHERSSACTSSLDMDYQLLVPLHCVVPTALCGWKHIPIQPRRFDYRPIDTLIIFAFTVRFGMHF